MLPADIMARACVIDFLGAKIFGPAIAIRLFEMLISSHGPAPVSTIRLSDLINFRTDYVPVISEPADQCAKSLQGDMNEFAKPEKSVNDSVVENAITVESTDLATLLPSPDSQIAMDTRTRRWLWTGKRLCFKRPRQCRRWSRPRGRLRLQRSPRFADGHGSKDTCD